MNIFNKIQNLFVINDDVNNYYLNRIISFFLIIEKYFLKSTY